MSARRAANRLAIASFFALIAPAAFAANWPAAVASTNTLFTAKNNLSTLLMTAVDGDDTTLTVQNASSFPDQGYVTVGLEAIFYSSKTATQFLQVTRGADGTTATTHSAGLRVFHAVIAAHHNALRGELVSMSTFFLQGDHLRLSTPTKSVGINKASSPTATLDVGGDAIFKGTSPWIDVRAYGAAGNGLADDTSAIQAAISAASTTAYGANIFFPPGQFKFSSQLAIPNGRLRFVGAGPAITSLKYAGTASPAIMTTGAASESGAVSFEGLSVRGSTQARHGLSVSRGQRFFNIYNCEFTLWPATAVIVDNTHTMRWDNVLFRDNGIAFDFGDTFVNSALLTQVSVENATGTLYSARIRNAIDIQWSGGTVENNLSGLRVENSKGVRLRDLYHEANSTSTPWIAITSAAAVHVAGNTFLGVANSTMIALGSNNLAGQGDGYVVQDCYMESAATLVQLGFQNAGPVRPALLNNTVIGSANEVVFSTVVTGPVVRLSRGHIYSYTTAGQIALDIGGSGSSIIDGSGATNLGWRLPQVSDSNRGFMTATTGLTIYNTDQSRMEFYNGTAWVGVSSVTPASTSLQSSTDVVVNADFDGNGSGIISLRINGSTAAVVSNAGRIGIGGNTLPGYSVDASSLSVAFASPTINGVAYTFPAADGSSGQFLRTSGAGALTWATVSGGTGTALVVSTGGSVVDSAVSTMNFSAGHFTLSSSPPGQANVSLNVSSATLLGPSIDSAELPANGYSGTYVELAGGAGAVMTGALQTTTLTVTGAQFSVGASTLVVASGRIGVGGNTLPGYHLDASSGSVSFASPTINGVLYDYPPADGSSGQVLKTNGAGVLTWQADNAGGGGGGGNWIASGDASYSTGAVVIGTSTIFAGANSANYGTNNTTQTVWITASSGGSTSPVKTEYMQASTYTTTNSSTTIFLYDLPADSTMLFVEANIYARCTGGASANTGSFFVVRGVWTNNSGLSTTNGTVTTVYEGNTQTGIQVTSDGTQAAIKVIGVASNNHTWHGYFRCNKLAS